MTKVSWNDVGQRFYEAGTDRGVLYLSGQAGVPWNGLTAVSENTSGGEPKAYYLDGYKYLNVAAAEEYAATINAFTSPREFDACDGTAAIHNGLFATQQPRRSFGFSYRTLVGNDVDGLSLGYKIHLVYNALAGPAQRSYTTNGDSATPLALNWSISTLPPRLPGIRPTAHFVIDSRLTPPRLLKAIEDILYGSDTTDPRLPTVDELADLFTQLPPIAAVNWLTNGSFERASGTVLVRKNYNTNARLDNDNTGWNTTASVATLAPSTSGAQVDVTVATSVPLFFQGLNMAVTTGDRWSSSMEITVPLGFPAASLQLRTFSYGSNVVVGNSEIVIVEPGTTVTLVANSTLPIAADSTGIRTILYGSNTAAGVRFFVKNALLEKAITVGEYFDGAQPPKVRRNAANRPQPTSGFGWFSNNGTIYTRTWDPTGGNRPGAGAALFTRQPNSINSVLASIYSVGTATYNTADTGWIRVVPGEVWTVSGSVRSDTPYKSNMSIAFFNEAGGNMGASTMGESTPDMAANSTTRATQTITVPPGARYMGIIQLVYSLLGTVVGGEKTWMTDALIERTANLGDFFDHTTTPPQGYLIASEGTAGASPTYMYDGDFTVSYTGAAGASESDLTGVGIAVYVSPSSVTRAIQSKHWAKSGQYSLRQIPMHIARNSAYTEIANYVSPRDLIAGNTYTFVISFYQPTQQGFAAAANSSRALSLISTTNPENARYVQATDDAGEQEIRLTFTVPTSGNWYLRLYNGGMYGDPSVWWDAAAVIDGVYDGPAFDGNTPDTDIRIYDWISGEFLSASTLRSWY